MGIVVALVHAGFLMLVGCWIVAARRSIVLRLFGCAVYVYCGLGLVHLLGNIVTFANWLIIAIVVAFGLYQRDGAFAFLRRSVAVTAVVLSVAIVSALWTVHGYSKLRAEYEFEDLRPRLGERITLATSQPSLKPSPHSDRADAESSPSEGPLRSWDLNAFRYPRVRTLRLLHRSTLESFLTAPEFGVGRMAGMLHISPRTLDRKQDPKTEKQHSEEPPPAWATDKPGPPPDAPQPGSWPNFFVDEKNAPFVDENRNGFVQSVERVAGFLPHRMVKYNPPNESNGWSVARIYLVGLVIHKEPTVYLTESLPDMASAKSAPTRPLDPFEREGLEALIAGKPQHSRGTDRLVRMLAPIQARANCIVCHGGKEGDLLGAFSYFIVKAEK